VKHFTSAQQDPKLFLKSIIDREELVWTLRAMIAFSFPCSKAKQDHLSLMCQKVFETAEELSQPESYFSGGKDHFGQQI